MFEENGDLNKSLLGQIDIDQLEPIEQKEEKIEMKKIDGQLGIEDLLNVQKQKIENQKKVLTGEKQQSGLQVQKGAKQVLIKDEYETIEKEKTALQNIETKLITKTKEQKMATEQDKTQNQPSGILFKSLENVLHESMIPYTEHVVMDRALPRVEDGLKPVQRRILYAMYSMGLMPDKPYRKSATVVGECLGKFHPHGDSSVYDASVRMVQEFSLREPLIDGHGNFGSIDGDGAAAYRYTEMKLKNLALELLRDIDKNTVHWSLNFDDRLKEPDTLPGRFPNLLVNGAYGIAVGVATNIPPHNLGEVIDAVVAYIDKPSIDTKGLI